MQRQGSLGASKLNRLQDEITATGARALDDGCTACFLPRLQGQMDAEMLLRAQGLAWGGERGEGEKWSMGWDAF